MLTSGLFWVRITEKLLLIWIIYIGTGPISVCVYVIMCVFVYACVCGGRFVIVSVCSRLLFTKVWHKI